MSFIKRLAGEDTLHEFRAGTPQNSALFCGVTARTGGWLLDSQIVRQLDSQIVRQLDSQIFLIKIFFAIVFRPSASSQGVAQLSFLFCRFAFISVCCFVIIFNLLYYISSARFARHFFNKGLFCYCFSAKREQPRRCTAIIFILLFCFYFCLLCRCYF